MTKHQKEGVINELKCCPLLLMAGGFIKELNQTGAYCADGLASEDVEDLYNLMTQINTVYAAWKQDIKEKIMLKKQAEAAMLSVVFTDNKIVFKSKRGNANG